MRDAGDGGHDGRGQWGTVRSGVPQQSDGVEGGVPFRLMYRRSVLRVGRDPLADRLPAPGALRGPAAFPRTAGLRGPAAFPMPGALRGPAAFAASGIW